MSNQDCCDSFVWVYVSIVFSFWLLFNWNWLIGQIISLWDWATLSSMNSAIVLLIPLPLALILLKYSKHSNNKRRILI